MKTRLLVAILIFTYTRSIASHVIGSDLTYRCLEGEPAGTFRIELALIRDCGGIPMCTNSCGAPCTRNIQITDAQNQTIFGYLALSLVNVRDVNPYPYCLADKSICNNMGCVQPGNEYPAAERYQFAGTINLNSLNIPASVCQIKFTWQECCRNNLITTGAAGQNYYTEMMLNRCVVSNPCNSSPNLTNDPILYLCKGQPFVFNNGAIDPELDSLTFEFAPSLQGPVNPVTYYPPYSYLKPMPYTPASGISCDPFTGDISFTVPDSVANATGVMSIATKQWTKVNNQMMLASVTRREIQLMSYNCPLNYAPYLATRPSLPGNLPKTSYEVCAGEQLCFDIIAKDSNFNPPNMSDTTWLGWSASLAKFGATFTPNFNPALRRINGPRESDFKFCWLTKDSFVASTPYYFTVSAQDYHYPKPGSITKAFSIRVVAKPKVLINIINENCGKYRVYISKRDSALKQALVAKTFSIAWEPDDFTFAAGTINFTNTDTTQVFGLFKPGKYLVRFSASTQGSMGQLCPENFYDTIVVKEGQIGIYPAAIIGPTIISNIADTLTYSVKKQEGIAYNWQITNGQLISGQGTDSIRVRWFQKQNGFITLHLSTTAKCVDSVFLYIGNTSNQDMDDEALFTFRIFPNPANGQLFIQSSLDLNNLHIAIFDVLGKKIAEKQITDKVSITSIPLLELNPGSYYIELTKDNKVRRSTFVKQ
jgi:hypothetical protein